MSDSGSAVSGFRLGWFALGGWFLLTVMSPGLGQEKAEADLPDIDIEIKSLEKFFESDKENQMMRAYLRRRVAVALDERRERVEALETPEQIAAYQERLRRFFRDTIDLDSFARGPLKAEVTGKLDRDGYVVEKVIFESLPGFSVTGNLYLPEGEGPFPGILHPCGHSPNGKAYEAYQRANILLARNGFAVLCFDPIGQGERLQLIDPKTGKKLPGGSGEHMVLGVAPVLLGRSLASYMIWDGMRGIDYLQSRAEIDPGRIGCMGNSGGGNLTSFLMALDDRIQAAAPGCFMTTTRLKNESPGPGDPEQNLFAQTREGLDHPDFAILRAPKPTLILSATHDYVPIEGTWDAFRQAKRIYTKLGYPERIDLVEAAEKHGFSQRLREGAVRFFSRWLKGGSVEVFEPEEVVTETDEDLFATPQGQVLAMEGERSLFEINRERMDEWKRERIGRGLATKSHPEIRTALRERLRIAPTDKAAEVLPVVGGVALFDSGSSAQGVWSTEPGIHVPFMRFAPLADGTPGSASRLPFNLVCADVGFDSESLGLVLDEADKDREAGERNLVFVNLRDSGLSKTKNWRFYGADAWIAYLLGDSYLAMRTEDLIAVARVLNAESEEGRPIHLHAHEEFVPVALHAAALEPGLFESVTLHGGIQSWEEIIDSRNPVPQWHNVVHGALRHYDLPDLIDLIGADKVRFK